MIGKTAFNLVRFKENLFSSGELMKQIIGLFFIMFKDVISFERKC